VGQTITTTARKETVPLGRGLFVLRYVKADDESNPPHFAFSVDPLDRDNLELISGPDAPAELTVPGECLVARVLRRSKLIVDVLPHCPGRSVAATLKIERLGCAESMNADQRIRTPELGSEVGGLQVLAHVAHLGDVTARPDEWVGGPQHPARIEGVTIEWPRRPPNVTLRYAVRIGGKAPRTSEIAEPGIFVGTRGRGTPLTGIIMELADDGAADFVIRAEAIFLGSAIVRAEGARLNVAGPTGKEPLVGLKFNIRPAMQKRTQFDAASNRTSTEVGQSYWAGGTQKAFTAHGGRTQKAFTANGEGVGVGSDLGPSSTARPSSETRGVRVFRSATPNQSKATR
jgi:hypothetical protein